MTTWFITGCSTGFGRAIATPVLEAGMNAAITARDPGALAELAGRFPRIALPLALDVTEHAQVVAAVAAVEDRFGGIDVLVNNAGYGLRGAVEEGVEADVRAQFDTNFFGLVDVTQQVLPRMRARRSGVIINLSSIGGRTALAGSGFYAASKFAVEGLSGALRLELEPLGIKVVVIEPGSFRTDFAGRSLASTGAAISDYAETAGPRRKENDRVSGTQPGDPEKAAAAIVRIAQEEQPPFRLLLGSDALARARTEIANQSAEIEKWAGVTASTDYAK